MNTIIGLLIIAVGSMGQSSSYVPINKIKEWSWENFWLTQGIFAWLVFPLLGALISNTPAELIEIYTLHPSAAWQAIGYGVLVGRGGTHFRTEHALSGNCLGTVGGTGYLCRIRNPYTGHADRHRPALAQGFDPAASRGGRPGWNRDCRLCRQPPFQKHVGGRAKKSYQRFCPEKGASSLPCSPV